jgi:predicted O-methyltransferase YrrM
MMSRRLLGRIWNRGRRVLAESVLGRPRRQEGLFSMLYPDGLGRPSQRLLDLLGNAMRVAIAEDLSSISERMGGEPRWPDIWPGEHYRLLAALVKCLRARRIVEIGTYQGLSALALMKHLPADGSVHTFDIVEWTKVAGGVLRRNDFADGRLVQVIDDVTRDQGFRRHAALFESADLIFVDAEKDGRMERRWLRLLGTIPTKNPIVVLDDIRLWNMLDIWAEIDRPKLDATSVGHYTGTGLVDWS